jgi:hypothetical protein
MNELAQQIGVVLAVSAAAIYLAVTCWRRAFGRSRAGGCGGCAKCPTSAATDTASTQGNALPLVSIDLSSSRSSTRRSH